MSNLVKSEAGSIISQNLDEALLNKIVQSGNLAYLSESDRLVYYFSYCRQLGLNPLSRPFDYITEGEGEKLKISLYPNTIAASQLRDSRNVSTKIIREEILLDGEVYSVLVEARMGDRTEEATGKVGIKLDKYGKPLSGDAKAKLMKKAESQARRRATLAIVGLDAMGEGDRIAPISDMPEDCWTPDLSDKLLSIASEPLPDWDKFWTAFCGVCDRCQSDEQLEKLIQWALNQKAYLAYPENQIHVENKIAEVKKRIAF
ncbi:MAG: hypothetical protein IM596_07915 [Pseudanabaena sp. M051S1SP2A07QC]|nr:hypothetical protein [Pseudanabaena sp. M109S1SP2A07QC]MCA6521768.1 hypothetical protein [Pseudanabaena sp. M051S1SP2A07QC]